MTTIDSLYPLHDVDAFLLDVASDDLAAAEARASGVHVETTEYEADGFTPLNAEVPF